MKENANIREELLDISPKLAKMQRNNPYRVPVDYFESLEESVMNTLAQTQQTRAAAESTPSLLLRLQEFFEGLFAPSHRWQLAGVTVAILTGIFFWLGQGNNEPTRQDLMATISPEEAMEYITVNIDEFDEALLENYATEQAIDLDDPIMDLDDDDVDALIDEIINEMDVDEFEDFL